MSGTARGAPLRLLLVGLGRMGIPYLERAHQQGFAVSVVDLASSLSSPETQARLHGGDRYYPVVASSTESLYSAACIAAGEASIDAVIALGEPHVIPAALISEELGLPTPGLRAAVTSRNKVLQRQLFGRRGLAQPAFCLAHSASDAAAWAADRYPVVAKPLSGAGSRGVQIIGDAAELATWCRAWGGREPFLVEEQLIGAEYIVECVIHEGRIAFWHLTAKTTTEPPYRVEMLHLSPPDIDARSLVAVEMLTTEIATALGIVNGIAHIDLILDAYVPKVIEVGVRTPGDYLMDLVEAASGVDMYEAAVQVSSGQQPTCTPVKTAAAAVWYPTVAPGRVTAISGIEAVEAIAGVSRVMLDVHVGSRVRPCRSVLDRVGAVVICADSAEELRQTIAKVRDTLVVDVE